MESLVIKIILLVWLYLLLIVINKFTNIITNILALKFDNDSSLKLVSTKYSEEEIIGHLDYIIDETIDEYVLYQLKPKNLYYINNKAEKEMTEYVTEKVTEKISSTLQRQLALLYDSDYIGKAIGSRVYAKELEFILSFNMANNKEGKK